MVVQELQAHGALAHRFCNHQRRAEPRERVQHQVTGSAVGARDVLGELAGEPDIVVTKVRWQRFLGASVDNAAPGLTGQGSWPVS